MVKQAKAVILCVKDSVTDRKVCKYNLLITHNPMNFVTVPSSNMSSSPCKQQHVEMRFGNQRSIWTELPTINVPVEK